MSGTASRRLLRRNVALWGILPAFVLALGVLAHTTGPAGAEEQAPSPGQVRQAVEKSLPFLMESSLAWREKRKCASCHQVPFTLWTANVAKRRGFAVDDAKVHDLSAWAFNFCATDVYQGKQTGGFLLTMGAMALAHETAVTPGTLQAYEVFAPIITRYQRPDGSWKEGNHIGVKGLEREGIEVDTMWTALALDSLDRLGERLPQQTRASVVAARGRALAWLGEGQPGNRTDWLALRMLLERGRGKVDRERALRRELLERQNPDGGWAFVKDGESLPHVTGECLYALGLTGWPSSDPAIVKASRYLVSTQRPDGSWEAISRQALGKGSPRKVDEITVHWGTAWATLGLLQTLPHSPDAETIRR